MHEQHQAGLRERRHRLEMFLEPVFEILGQAFVHGAAEQRHVQRVAVGLGTRHRLDRQVASGAAAILDVDLLAEQLAELGADHAADDVARPAGGKSDHEANGFGRIGRWLRSRDIGRRARQRDHSCRQGDARNTGANDMQSATQQAHRFLPERSSDFIITARSAAVETSRRDRLRHSRHTIYRPRNITYKNAHVESETTRHEPAMDETLKPFKSETRDGMRIDWDVPIPMEDGTVLRADLFRPLDDDKHPVILSYGAFGKGLAFQDGNKSAWDRMIAAFPEVAEGSTCKYQVWEVVDPEKWVPDGYACLRIDARGAGRSPGYLDPWSPRETQDIYQSIEWAAAQPWCSGKVGMNGISYFAMNQWYRRPAPAAAPGGDLRVGRRRRLVSRGRRATAASIAAFWTISIRARSIACNTDWASAACAAGSPASWCRGRRR